MVVIERDTVVVVEEGFAVCQDIVFQSVSTGEQSILLCFRKMGCTMLFNQLLICSLLSTPFSRSRVIQGTFAGVIQQLVRVRFLLWRIVAIDR